MVLALQQRVPIGNQRDDIILIDGTGLSRSSVQNAIQAILRLLRRQLTVQCSDLLHSLLRCQSTESGQTVLGGVQLLLQVLFSGRARLRIPPVQLHDCVDLFLRDSLNRSQFVPCHFGSFLGRYGIYNALPSAVHPCGFDAPRLRFA